MTEHRGVIIGLFFLAAAGAAAMANAAPAADWCRVDDPVSWRASEGKGCPSIADPQTLPDELALPLPCGRWGVFRKVVVPVSSVLDHAMIWIGSTNDEGGSEDLRRVVNVPRQTPLAGGFTLDKNGKPLTSSTAVMSDIGARAYYVGKYELPEHHWKIFEQGLFETATEHDSAVCAAYDAEVARLNDRRVRPATGLSWFDAVTFTQAWTNWLLALDRARIPDQAPYLPWEQGTPAYVRLPTEAEWEFAARGGVARQEDAVLATYLIRPADGGSARPARLEEIAVTVEVGSGRRGPLESIGSKAPNLLGIHDTVGNVDEIVFDMFRLTRPDVLHGQYGGFVVKGGNVFTSPGILSVAHRREVPFFDLRGERRSETTGFRPALALPVFISGIGQDNRWQAGLQNPALMEAMLAAQASLVRSNDDERVAVFERLGHLQQEAADGRIQVEALQSSLAEIQRSLERSNAQLNERNRQVLRERFQSVALIGLNVASLGRNILATQMTLADVRERFSEEELRGFQSELAALEQRIKDTEQNLSAAFRYYTGSIMSLAGEDAAAIADAVAATREQTRSQAISTYERYIDFAEANIAEVREAGGSLGQGALDRWLATLDESRERREARFN